MISRALFVSLLLSAHPPAKDGVRAFEVPGHRALGLELPASWEDMVEQPPRGQPPTLRFIPKDRHLKLVVTPMFSPQNRQGWNRPERLKELIVRSAAMEPESKLFELRRDGVVVGHAFTSKDPAPKPGEHTYMTEGEIGLDELAVSFMFFSNEADSAELHAAVHALLFATRG